MDNPMRHECLKQARERLGLNRGQMAEVLGLNFSTYSMIERGERTLSPKYISLIVEKTDVSRTFLETGKGEILRSDKNQTLYDLIMSLEDNDKQMLIAMAQRLAEASTSED